MRSGRQSHRQAPTASSLTRQAHGAYIANVDNLAVAEASSAKVDLILSRLSEVLASRRTREESHLREIRVSELLLDERKTTYDEILEETGSALDLEVGAARQMTSLLQEDGVWSKDLADVYGDVLRRRERGQHRERAKSDRKTHVLLRSEDAIHDGHILRGSILRDAHDGYPRLGLAETRHK